MKRTAQFYGWVLVFVLANVAAQLHGGTGAAFAAVFGMAAGAVWQVSQRVDPVDRLAFLMLFLFGGVAIGALAVGLGSNQAWWTSGDALEDVAFFLGIVTGLVLAEQVLRRRDRNLTTVDPAQAATSRQSV